MHYTSLKLYLFIGSVFLDCIFYPKPKSLSYSRCDRVPRDSEPTFSVPVIGCQTVGRMGSTPSKGPQLWVCGCSCFEGVSGDKMNKSVKHSKAILIANIWIDTSFFSL